MTHRQHSDSGDYTYPTPSGNELELTKGRLRCAVVSLEQILGMSERDPNACDPEIRKIAREALGLISGEIQP